MDADSNSPSTSTHAIDNITDDPVALGDASVSTKSEVIVDTSSVHTTDLEKSDHINESVTMNIETANEADGDFDLKDSADDVDPNSEDIELKWEDDNEDEEECLDDKEMPELEGEVKMNSSDVMEVDEANQQDDNKISDTVTPVVNDSNDKTILSDKMAEGHDSELNIVNNQEVNVENLETNEITDATNIIGITVPLDTEAEQSIISNVVEKNTLGEAVTTEVSHVSELMTEENSEISTVEEDLVIENRLQCDEIKDSAENTEENAIHIKALSNVSTDTNLSVCGIENTESGADPEDETGNNLPVTNEPTVENINFDLASICDKKQELDIFNHMVFNNETDQNTVPSSNDQKLEEKDDKTTPNAEDSCDVESFLNSSLPINNVPNETESDIDKMLESEILDDNNESGIEKSKNKIVDDIVADINVTSTSNSSNIANAQEENLNNLKETSNNDDIDKTAKTVISEILPSTSSITDDTKNTQVDAESLLPVTTDITEEDMTKETQEISASTASDKEPIPSTSAVSIEDMSPDASDEIPEVTDSLGLLAESTMRVMDEEDEEDDDDEEFDGDDADDAGYDESTVTPEHSEDSNAQISENETSKEPVGVSTDVTFTGKLIKKEAEGEKEIEAAQKEIEDKIGEEEVVEDKEVLESMSVDVTPDKSDETSLESVEGKEKIDTDDKSDCGTNDATERADLKLETVSGNTDIEAVAETEAAVQNQAIVATDAKESTSEVPNESDAPMTEKELGASQSESPSKLKNLKITRNAIRSVVNIVDLEESSSEDDIQEIRKAAEEIYDDSDNSLNRNQQAEEQETILCGLLKAPPMKMTRLNTSEVTIKTGLSSVPKLVIPEVDTSKQLESNKSDSGKTKCGSEIVTLYSDEEEPGTVDVKDETSHAQVSPPTDDIKRRRCVNPDCTNSDDPTVSPTPDVLRFYNVKRKRKALVCQNCSDVVTRRALLLMEGVKSMMPLLELDMSRPVQSLVEISDSDSDEEGPSNKDDTILLGGNVEMLEQELADVINGTWSKYDLEGRLEVAKTDIETQLEEFEKDCKEINEMLRECQRNTDAVRRDLYATFAQRTHQLTSLDIYDTPQIKYTKLVERDNEVEVRRSKRPRGQAVGSTVTSGTPIDAKEDSNSGDSRAATATKPADDDCQDISVVRLCVEKPPVGLPARSDGWSRPPLSGGEAVFAMRHAFGTWQRARILEVYPRATGSTNTQFTMCKVKFEVRGVIANISARHIAYSEAAPVRLTIGTRVIAVFKDTTGRSAKRGMSYYSGVIAEMPNPVNNYRYLVFFDDGYAQYVPHGDTRAVVECSPLVWEEVHPFSREFVRLYLLHYPERPMVRLHAGQTLKTEWNGKWWVSRVLETDASLVKVYFEADRRTEWIYRGSTRLAPLFLEFRAAERAKGRPAPRHKHSRQNMPYVEYTRTDEQDTTNVEAQKQEEIKRQRAVAKKSTALPPAQPPPTQDPGVTSRVVYYTPKAAVRPHAMTSHTCSVRCQRTDVLPLRELRTYNPLARPLLSGWERQIVKFKGRKEIMYRAPCGRRLRNMSETHKYLRLIHSEMSVDLFDFALNTHCLAEFVLNKCLVSKKDLSHGKENVPVPCVNYFDNSLPEFCSYNTERTPTAGVPLNIDPDFLCGCDCEDDCVDKSKCDCWKLTLTGAKTIGMDGEEVGYVYKRLLEPVPSGIYECNSRCKCKQTCLNRVAQHPLQLKLQVFKTQNRGWGIRALNDVPRGAFLCVYAGNLLTDATANLDGLNEGDEYLAELDYIEVVEQMKEGYEEDIPAADKKLDEEDSNSESEEESLPSDDEKKPKKQDDDFKPAYDIPKGVLEFKKRLRKRDKLKKEKHSAVEGDSKETEGDKDTEKKRDEDCITISDDEEVREPQSFSAQTGMGGNDLVSRYRSVRSFFGKDEACYIMDAKVQGNIGRYLNHSCTPNVFVQNVFVDTHDPRFPWVSFFALSHIKAGAELTWNYNYDVGSVPGKTLYCYCGAPNCRGRLL